MNRIDFVSLLAIVGMQLVPSLASADTVPAGHEKASLKVDGHDREYIIHIPKNDEKTKPIPLVIMLHGMGGSALNALRETGWSAKADQESFIIVYPEATRPDPKKPPSLSKNPQSWNDGSGRFHSAEKKIDDVAFLKAIIDQVKKDHRVDPQRIFITGFSNGASMTFRAGAELSNQIAAIAPNAGACWTETPKLERPISICYITGTADTLNPLDGGFPKLALGGKDQGGERKPAVQSTINKWANVLECPEKPNRDETTNGVRTRSYGPGRKQAEVVFITVEGMGHVWAGGVSAAPEFLVGKPTNKIKATDVVWEFFKNHPAP
jgi:polyhydroxybutyrate depolymerase